MEERIPDMGYEQAVSTIMLATHCVCCGRPLRDPESVTRGMGPECSREGYLEAGPNKDEANRLIHHAAVAAIKGEIQTVLDYADRVSDLGYSKVADKMRKRFRSVRQKAKIRISKRGTMLFVETPYKRKSSQEFVQAWRDIPGREWDGYYNKVPVTQRVALWKLLQRFFQGEYGIGPKGLFRVSQAL